MPNRILKDSICTSDTIDALSPEEECFFYRLIVTCDDFGYMDARPSVLRARLYPLRIDIVSDADVVTRLDSLEKADLIRRYAVGGKPYLQVLSWEDHQQIRAKRSKYPPPPDDHDGPTATHDRDGQHLISFDSRCYQMMTSAPARAESNPIRIQSESNLVESSESDDESFGLLSPPDPSPAKHPSPADDGFEAFMAAYPKQMGKREARERYVGLLKLPKKEGITKEYLHRCAINYAEECRILNRPPDKIKQAQYFLSPSTRPFEDYANGMPNVGVGSVAPRGGTPSPPGPEEPRLHPNYTNDEIREKPWMIHMPRNSTMAKSQLTYLEEQYHQAWIRDHSDSGDHSNLKENDDYES
jgi:hypothetical protein